MRGYQLLYGKDGKLIGKRIALDKLVRAADDMAGFCRACGHRMDNVEQDARFYHCEQCGLNQVFGAEEWIS